MNDELAIQMLGALAQPTRFAVFRLLMAAGPDGLPAGRIAAEVSVPQNTLSAHLNILSGAGLIAARRDGRSLIYSVEIPATKGLISHLVHDCCGGHPEICGLTPEDGSGGCC